MTAEDLAKAEAEGLHKYELPIWIILLPSFVLTCSSLLKILQAPDHTENVATGVVRQPECPALFRQHQPNFERVFCST